MMTALAFMVSDSEVIVKVSDHVKIQTYSDLKDNIANILEESENEINVYNNNV